MIDARRMMRWIAAAALLALAGCSIVSTTPEAPAAAPVPAPAQPTAPAPPPAPLRAAPPPQSVAADGLGHVALLMPISGKLSSAGLSLREGFMTAYFQAPAAQRLHIRF